jgi:adenylylsulfate kinase-like enzyme
MNRKILIMGLPGAGKTTLARILAPTLSAVLFNADEVRANINRELGFSHEDRIEHTRRMGWLGAIAIAMLARHALLAAESAFQGRCQFPGDEARLR